LLIGIILRGIAFAVRTHDVTASGAHGESIRHIPRNVCQALVRPLSLARRRAEHGAGRLSRRCVSARRK
jgi:hypothetical protein